MDSIPAHVVLWVSASCCTYRVAVHNFAVPAVHIWVEVVFPVAISAASLDPIL